MIPVMDDHRLTAAKAAAYDEICVSDSGGVVTLYALADDGSIWTHAVGFTDEWGQIAGPLPAQD